MNNTLSKNRPDLLLQITKQHILGAIFLSVVILLIGYLLYSTTTWMLDEQRLPLSKVIIQGEREYTSDSDVQQALSKLSYIGTFMTQDVDELQQSVIGLPWVAQASVRKQWPDLIKIYLVEHKPTAVWNGNELLNQSGDVFQGDVAELNTEKIKLYGPAGSSRTVLSTWQQAEPYFSPLGLSIDSLVLNERRAWQIILDNGIRLELGKDSLTERIERFVSLYYRLGDQREKVSYIDLRYDTGAAVGWFPEQELEQESTDD